MSDPRINPTWSIVYSEEDKEYVATCSEYPSLSWLDKDPAKALIGLMKVVREVQQDIEQEKEEDTKS